MTGGVSRDRAGRSGDAALTLASMSRLRPGRRTAAILAILLLLAVAGSDLLIAGFWLSHPMLTAIVSALVVVVLSVAVIEVVLSRRAERRWRVLAQTALMELGEAASTTWRALAQVLLALRVLPQAWWDRRTVDLAAATRAARPLPAADR